MSSHPDAADDLVRQLKRTFIPHIMACVDPKLIDLQTGDEAALKKRIEEVFEDKMKHEKLPLAPMLRTRVLKEIVSEIIG